MPERVRSWRSVAEALGYAAIALAFVAGAASERPLFGVLAALPLLYAWRATRIGLALHADHAEVVTALRTRRIPYASVESVDLDEDGNVCVVTDDDIVLVTSTAGVDRARLKEVRKRFVSYIKAVRPAEVEDELDERPPYDAVLRLLEHEDPLGVVESGEPDGYLYEAEELADVLRERPLTADDLSEILEVQDDVLLDRLNAAR